MYNIDDAYLQMQSVLRQLLTEVRTFVTCARVSPADTSIQTSGHRMELIIILLIAVEVVIVSGMFIANVTSL